MFSKTIHVVVGVAVVASADPTYNELNTNWERTPPVRIIAGFGMVLGRLGGSESCNHYALNLEPETAKPAAKLLSYRNPAYPWHKDLNFKALKPSKRRCKRLARCLEGIFLKLHGVFKSTTRGTRGAAAIAIGPRVKKLKPSGFKV